MSLLSSDMGEGLGGFGGYFNIHEANLNCNLASLYLWTKELHYERCTGLNTLEEPGDIYLESLLVDESLASDLEEHRWVHSTSAVYNYQ